MDKLLLQVRRAQRRLVVEQFLKWLVGCLSAALLVAAVAIALPQIVVIEGLPSSWTMSWVVAAVIGGFLAAGVGTWMTRRSEIDAAMEIDRRFALRERVASSLALAPEVLETPAGQALLHDAAKRVDRIDVSEKFRPRVDRRAWLPLLPALLVFCLVMFGENREAVSQAGPVKTVKVEKQIEKTNEELRKKLAKKRELAKQQGLKDAEEIFKQLEEEAKKLSKDEKLTDRKKASVKLNNLAKQLEERKKKLGSSNEMKKQMGKMKQFGKGPAEKVAEAMKQGDWKKAIDEIKKLQDKIASDKLTKKEKQQLQDQMKKMKDKLAEAAQANRDAMEDLKKKIAEQRKQGNLDKAGELQQKLDKLAQKQPQMQNLDKLAKQLQQCQDCMQNGDKEGAAQAMSKIAEQLKQMKQENDEMEMLDQALDQIEMAKNGMNCNQCQGAGCEACNGGMGANDKFNDKPGGQGMGAGRGSGPRPDEKNPTQFRDTRVRQKPGKGAATFGGFVDGPNVKGKTTAEMQEEELAAINSEPADPLTSQRLPRTRVEQAEQYFELLREE